MYDYGHDDTIKNGVHAWIFFKKKKKNGVERWRKRDRNWRNGWTGNGDTLLHNLTYRIHIDTDWTVGRLGSFFSSLSLLLALGWGKGGAWHAKSVFGPA